MAEFERSRLLFEVDPLEGRQSRYELVGNSEGKKHALFMKNQL